MERNIKNDFLPIELKCTRYVDPRPSAVDGDLRGCYVNGRFGATNKCTIAIFNQLINYKNIPNLELECTGPNGKGFILISDWIAEIKCKKILIKIMESDYELHGFNPNISGEEIKKYIGL